MVIFVFEHRKLDGSQTNDKSVPWRLPRWPFVSGEREEIRREKGTRKRGHIWKLSVIYLHSAPDLVGSFVFISKRNV